ncbi:MAG: hypothetical protein QM658_13720 [Gordonia sp. (in: high G+C Gram-positive bacteria)]
MPKVTQIRGLPDDAHEALVRAAEVRGMSLTRYVRSELEAVARRSEAARLNADVVWATKQALTGQVDRAAILDAVARDRRT